ncbi:glycerate kinase [Halotalea alkalilenta]|uniref:Glycerate kinase n=1 Tax=Halotalea alkalilenta TaxID=376489 RepID=A0A172YJ01_9GAMM|nr:glycerate kinase [Halotalea alkalilenta]ANF59201.1 glycerate kinase [Halotalea alkalilenta]
MRIVIAPDSFKDALSAQQAAKAIGTGARAACADAELVECPLGDGGEGTLDAVLAASGAVERRASVHDPLGRPIEARWGLIERDGERSAIVELAEASGLQRLLPAERDARVTSTYGLGELLIAALDEGVEHLVLTLGGSATNDGGSGMLAALGARFLDAHGEPLPPGGAALAKLARIELDGLDPRLARVRFEAAVDVDNPLCGERGASAVFGPQKGADPATVAELDAALMKLAEVAADTIGEDHRELPGAGAAGGMGFAARVFLQAQLRPGIELVIEQLGFEALLEGADLLFVGEGGLDAQSLGGKTPIGAARVAKRLGIPCIALVGKLGPGWQGAHQQGVTAAFALADGPMSLEQALPRTFEALAARTEEVVRLWQAARG